MQIPLYLYKTDRTRTPRSYFPFFLALCVSPLLWVFALTQPAYAATSEAVGHGTLTWDSSMVYAGQNNGLPWGPVGETAIVRGSGFPTTHQSLTLVLVAGNSNTNPLLCNQLGVSVASVTVNASGQFSTGFFWPAAAGSVGQQYSICARTGTAIAGARDSNGPFTVLAGAPTIRVSTSSVAAGNSITVSGQNWVPPQSITVVVGNCGDCVGAPSNTVITNTTSSSGLHSGTFSIILFVPGSFPPGTYRVNAYARINPSTRIALLDASHTMTLPRLTISAATATATPTVSPTASPTNTATVAVAGTRTVAAGGPGTPNTGAQDTNHLSPVLLLGALLPLLLTIIGLAIYIVRQRKQGPSSTVRVLPSRNGRFQAYAVSDQPAHSFQARSVSDAGQFNDMSTQFAPQQNWPQSALSFETGVDPSDQTTVSDIRPYGAVCFKCSTPLPAGSQFCGNCGTNNDEFFA